MTYFDRLVAAVERDDGYQGGNPQRPILQALIRVAAAVDLALEAENDPPTFDGYWDDLIDCMNELDTVLEHVEMLPTPTIGR